MSTTELGGTVNHSRCSADTEKVRGGYFIRARPLDGASTLPPDGSEPHPRRHRVNARRWVLLALVIAVVGSLAWAQSTDGGVSARVEDGISAIKRITGLDNTDPTLRAAESVFDGVFEARGNYVATGEELRLRGPQIEWSSDVRLHQCPGGRAVVIVVDTAVGTKSRLLLDGKRVGDVDGDVTCPADLSNPVPWK